MFAWVGGSQAKPSGTVQSAREGSREPHLDHEVVILPIEVDLDVRALTLDHSAEKLRLHPCSSSSSSSLSIVVHAPPR